MPLSDTPPWAPTPLELWSEYADEQPDLMPASLLFRHPTRPFVSQFKKADDNASTLQRIASEYLNKVVSEPAEGPTYLEQITDAAGAQIPAPTRALIREWVGALGKSPPDPRFGWLRFAEPGDTNRHPMASYRFDRQTVVLLASERIGSGFDAVTLASGFGIRVVAHLREVGGTPPDLELRITGFSASLPFGEYLVSGVWTLDAERLGRKILKPSLEQAVKQIATVLNLTAPVYSGIRLKKVDADTTAFEAHGTSLDGVPPWPSGAEDDETNRLQYGKLASAFYVRGTHYTRPPSDKRPPIEVTSLEKVPMVADGVPPTARGFVREPASAGGRTDMRTRRPTRSDTRLGKLVQNVTLTTPAGHFVVERAPSWKVEPPLPGTHSLRSNAFSESSAAVNVDRCFAALSRSGLDPSSWFRLARQPLHALYRSGIRPGPGKDGDTVNARVYLGFWGQNFFDDQLAEPKLPLITVHLALADRMRRSRQLPHPAQTMGIGADPRWVWHEFGHVLLAAAVGELEFRFAHSAGDALAAIACDPHSELGSPLRGATFPWVFIPRRHDRCPTHGWSWSGSLHRSRALCAQPDRVRRRGYLSEQILSSSLFRLYLALGGGSTDARTREVASDYTIYLIVRAIGLLGYAGAVPAHTPDHLVSALIDADIGSEAVTLAPWDSATGAPVVRIGGCAHKAIRWAFEQQGLYGAPGRLTNGPGLPPAVDVYIADGRPESEAKPYGETMLGRGHYAPTPHAWDDTGRAAWYAGDDGIEINGDDIYVKVGNRGAVPADSVSVHVWFAAHNAGNTPPAWNAPNAWTPLDGPGATAKVPAGAGSVRFGPFKAPPGKPLPARCLIFAEATCVADRANTDDNAQLACGRMEVALIDLVSGDNNLALRVRAP